MTKMNQLNTTERTTVESVPEIPAEGLPHAILSEIERLQSEHFNNTTVTGHSLLFNHTRCDSVYLNEMLADFGPEFPTLDLNSGFTDKTLSDSINNLPETNPTKVAANFVKDICEEITPTSNDCAIQKNEIGLGAEFVVMLNQLQSQKKNNSDLKSRVMQQQQMILDLQKYNLELDGEMVKQHDIILEMRKKLNALTETYRFSYQTSASERLQPQEMPQVDQEPAVELSDRRQTKISEVETVTTNDRSLITDIGETDQLQDIECVQSSTGDEAETQSDSEKMDQSDHAAPSTQEDNFNQSHSSLGMKQVRSTRIREGGGKRIKFNLESIEEYPTNARNFRQREKPYECEVCNAAFIQSSDLRRHQRTHSGEKPYVCEECGTAFSQAGSLKTHQRIHSGEKPYECEVCNAVFNHPSHLRRHQRTHSGEKPYECEVCNAAFSDLSNLRRHQRMHSDNKPFSCDICKKSFGQKITLSRHMDIHSGKKSHKCNQCQKEFRRKYSLMNHLETHS